MPLEGNYRVRVFRPAWGDATAWFPRRRHRMELRSQALKLRFWPTKNPTDGSGRLLDLDWCWIKALSGRRIGELRVDDEIGGHDNIRVIVFVGEAEPLPRKQIIWILAVLQKKRNEWTKNNLTTFRARQVLVVERYYRHRMFD